jgi:hypothetical protein
MVQSVLKVKQTCLFLLCGFSGGFLSFLAFLFPFLLGRSRGLREVGHLNRFSGCPTVCVVKAKRVCARAQVCNATNLKVNICQNHTNIIATHSNCSTTSSSWALTRRDFSTNDSLGVTRRTFKKFTRQSQTTHEQHRLPQIQHHNPHW